MMRRLQAHWACAVILGCYLILATAYSAINPLFESPDEVWHYEYVRWLVEGNGLPEPEDVGHAPWHQEGSQPPLYYLLTAALTWPIPTDNAAEIIRYNPHGAIGQAEAFGNRNMMAHGPAEAFPWQGVALAAHAARLLSVVIGAFTVLFTYLAARTAFPARGQAAVLAAALVAFNPQFLFINGSANNDGLVAMLCAAGLYALLALLTRRRWDDAAATWMQDTPRISELILLGVLAGLAALSKLSGLLLSLFVGLVLTVIAVRARTLWGLVKWGLISGGVFVAVAGWWFLRNLLLFGDPLLLTAMFAILPRRPEPPTLTELLARAEGVWRSFWAVFGWFNVVADPWVYQFYSILTLIGFAGLLVGLPLRTLWRDDADERDAPADAPARSNRRLSLAVLGLWLMMILLLLLRWATMRYPQGRLLFPAISALAILVAYGWTNWTPARLRPWLAGGLSLVLLIIAVQAPVRWIAPAYAAPVAETPAAAIPNPLDVHFDSGEEPLLALDGFEFGQVELAPGDALEVDLYWRAPTDLATDYSVFIHLIDENEILQAQRDSYPGAGSAPTSDWQPGTRVFDRHRITVPAGAPAPARLKVNVGVYDYQTGERLLVGGYDHWTLGYVTLLPKTDDSGFPNPVDIRFDDKMALRGFEFDSRTVAPGDTLGVTLWWEALSEMEIDYKVFVHYVLPPEATWAQKDDDPQDGRAPTSGWVVGDIVEDRYEIRLPDEAPPGVYFVEIGVYDRATNDRLKVNFSDKGIVLGQFRVE